MVHTLRLDSKQCEHLGRATGTCLYLLVTYSLALSAWVGGREAEGLTTGAPVRTLLSGLSKHLLEAKDLSRAAERGQHLVSIRHSISSCPLKKCTNVHKKNACSEQEPLAGH